MKYIIATLLILLVAANAFGQTKITVLSYQMSVPDQNLEKFIDETSFRGVGFDGRWFMGGSSFTGGLSLAWHVFDKSTTGTIELENSAITGKQSRYVNSFPIMLTGHLYFGNKNKLWMFVGGGVGTYYIIQRLEIGVQALEETDWRFGAVPEIGLQIPLSEADFFISGKYNWIYEAGGQIEGDPVDYNYWTVSVGLAYQGW